MRSLKEWNWFETRDRCGAFRVQAHPSSTTAWPALCVEWTYLGSGSTILWLWAVCKFPKGSGRFRLEMKKKNKRKPRPHIDDLFSTLEQSVLPATTNKKLEVPLYIWVRFSARELFTTPQPAESPHVRNCSAQTTGESYMGYRVTPAVRTPTSLTLTHHCQRPNTSQPISDERSLSPCGVRKPRSPTGTLNVPKMRSASK